jgi:branched-chain amino acid transport system substrate-binding protein
MRGVKLLTCVLIVLLVTLLVSPYSTPKAQVPLKPYKIGAFFDLSGFNTSIGVPSRNGAVVACDGINTKGTIHGRSLELVIYDSASDVTRAVSTVKRLIEADNVVAIAGGTMTGSVLASVETVTNAGVPFMSGAAGVDIWRPTKKWVFSTANGNDNYLPRACDYLKRKGLTKVAFEYMDSAYGESGRKQLEGVASKYGLTIVGIEKHKPTDLDMVPQLTRLAAAHPDVILLESYQRDAAVFMKSVRTLGVTIPVLGTAGTAGADIIRIGGEAVEGFEAVATRPIVASQLPDADPSKPLLLKFIKAYEEKFGVFDYYASNSYDALHLVADALEKSDARLDPYTDEGRKNIGAQIRDNLENTKDFLGTNGKYNLSADKHNGEDLSWCVIIRVVNGKWKLVH